MNLQKLTINLHVLLFLGMMIESMAGKSASLHGVCHDATPFQFSEEEPAIDHFGKLLVKGNSHTVVYPRR